MTEYYAPTDVMLGKDAVSMCGEMLARNKAGKVLIHYGSERVVRNGLIGQITRQLDEKGIGYVLLGGAQPNPRLSLVRKGIALGREENVDFLLAVGGGSAIDSAKAMAYGLYDEGDVWDFYTGARKPSGSFPLGVVLTLAATGSEMSDSSVITNEDGGLKRGCNSNFCRPRFALLDPTLTYSVPPYQTSCGTADIMMHTLERYFHPSATLDLTDKLSIALLRSVIENGQKALQDPEDYDARANLMWASSLSHNGLMQVGNGNRGDWACHQMEHELSGMYDVAHGAALTALWGSWARYVYKDVLGRFYTFAIQAMGVRPSGTREEIALKGIEAAEEWFRAIGLPTSIGELGITLTDEQVKEMARRCAEHCGGVKGSCRRLKERDMYEIYKAAL